jgi:Raf kinase inhibitor-like YbhB/YbcL family protein
MPTPIRAMTWLFLLALAAAGCKDKKIQSASENATGPGEKKPSKMDLSSEAFAEGEAIPEKHTCKGADQSPPLKWSAPPEGTRSLALICDDPDAPSGTWVHWVVYGIPPETTSLQENFPGDEIEQNAIRQGKNDFKKTGYGGPCPPPGKAHRYFFKIYALDIPTDLPPGLAKEDLLEAMKGHILAMGELTGTFSR